MARAHVIGYIKGASAWNKTKKEHTQKKYKRIRDKNWRLFHEPTGEQRYMVSRSDVNL